MTTCEPNSLSASRFSLPAALRGGSSLPCPSCLDGKPSGLLVLQRRQALPPLLHSATDRASCPTIRRRNSGVRVSGRGPFPAVASSSSALAARPRRMIGHVAAPVLRRHLFPAPRARQASDPRHSQAREGLDGHRHRSPRVRCGPRPGPPFRQTQVLSSDVVKTAVTALFA